jgi:thiamine-phosphate pyrophosphorylase
MPPDDFTPLLCLVTDGSTNAGTTPDSPEFLRLLDLIEAAAAAELPLAQIREKALSPRVLHELTRRAAALTHGSATRLLVNDRADIARAAGADGAQLAAQSLAAATVRRAFGPDFVIGVSTHSLAEAQAAKNGGADFVIFGPVFDTPSKRAFGPPQGTNKLAAVARAVAPLPVIAIGGITLENAPAIFASGAAGLAAIRLFSEADDLCKIRTSLSL